ncbi:serine/threonine protein phosphatase PP1, putative [Entamoeba histolytica HM-1:IMSS-B]|uniref:Serine/threonine-protein phosphatase n=6 Tax=Entamoeba histolytica TaxID=5759 RepID=C4M9M5_ENTH1|nr:serine/threonine protein phosphatase PP1, putative [Entamoeba histolytica HM-1:IMSS]EMD48175.1 serine/threonine protein phosphatase PP1, putative [Entamoeba histolytica KU27]EMH75628.1 serine/threonine protein phosphatase PP1, putative [Entamoeba histolytica HM-1:IMSS-B]EMS12911.1 serine/threonine protein phosphatase PP1, putative [Entamoeba histolytica HM-3:IMSS]ENY61135.1 serine/threonine protein phosphatase PP1, putative [Entamoeba histolytica HM-1:IMSS-A]GAT98384.1 serine threonine prot|eukprot:XP_656101.1 serine/threonine protein phosphatase PP1, putative [Entamoeba histolytica HM-1:IMSS]
MEEQNQIIPMKYFQYLQEKLLKFNPQTNENCLCAGEITDIISTVIPILENEPTLLELSPPINIIGDIHGCFNEMVELLKKTVIPNASFLFLGDYIDRGKFGIEVMCLLYLFKIQFPNQFFLLRGNHESFSVSSRMGVASFHQQCVHRYSEIISFHFFNSFNYLPIACLVDHSMLCLHAGISPDLKNIGQLKKIHRPIEIPERGLLFDILWSDPFIPQTSTTDNKTDIDYNGFIPNTNRQCSYFFGQKALDTFLQQNQLKYLCRGHQVADGFQLSMNNKCITVFSCPGYGTNNRAGMLVINKGFKCQFVYSK